MRNTFNILCTLIASFGVPSLVSGEVISSTDFEAVEAGVPLSRKIFQGEGFTTGTWDNGLADRTLVDTAEYCSGGKSMRIMYPKGGYGTSETGCQVQLRFDRIDEAFASYRLRFSEDFTWGTTSYGGKLPGLGGGNNCSGGSNCDGTNGFSARFMWRAGGKAVLYLYHMDKPATYGEDVDLVYPDGSPVIFERGKWFHIAERVKVNSSADSYDGEVEVWVNGEQVLLRDGLRFVTNDDRVDNLYISTFHGGSDRTWAPTDTCFTWIDDIRIGTTYEDVAFSKASRNEAASASDEEIKVTQQTADELRVEGLKGGAEVSVYSVNGRKLRTCKAKLSTATVNVSGLKGGSFIIQVKDESGRIVHISQFITSK